MTPLWRDRPIQAFMVAQTVIWAAIFYSFPALVLTWQADFGWSASDVMGALSLALIVQAVGAPLAGRLVDRGKGPVGFGLGGCAAVLGLIALSQVTSLTAFYLVWAALGLAMAFTLYDACFALVTRARGKAARVAITAITLAAGFASSISYPLTTWIAASHGWRDAVLVLAAMVAVLNLPLSTWAAARLEHDPREKERPTQSPKGMTAPVAKPAQLWPLRMAFALVSLATGIVLSHLFPLMAAFGITGGLAIVAASLIGPAQVTGRVVLFVAGGQIAARRLAQGTIIAMAAAIGLLAAAGVSPGLIVAFAVLQGLGYGLVSIARPVLIHDVLGDASFGLMSGRIAQGALLAFAVAPALSALIADTFGYGWVLVLCLAAQLGALACLGSLRPK